MALGTIVEEKRDTTGDEKAGRGEQQVRCAEEETKKRKPGLTAGRSERQHMTQGEQGQWCRSDCSHTCA